MPVLRWNVQLPDTNSCVRTCHDFLLNISSIEYRHQRHCRASGGAATKVAQTFPACCIAGFETSRAMRSRAGCRCKVG
jgi:hypothetical protein